MDFLGGTSGRKEKKKPPAHAEVMRDVGLTSGSGRSPGESHGNPLQ